MNKKGMLIILSGPSGCGKGTVLSALLARRDDTVISISATTRNPRVGEQDGVQYFFRSKEQFEQMIEKDQLLEYANYNGNYYGTPSAPVEQWLSEGKNVVLEIEVQGAQKVMSRCKDHVSIFITPPSVEVLEQRLRGRGTETEDVIRGRLDAAKKELEAAKSYQYIVCNDEIENAVDKIEAILEAESMKTNRT
jgi:guanylate kinase